MTKQFSSRNNSVKAIDDMSLTIEAGEIFGVIGESGAGKSTLLRFINGLETMDSGQVIIDDIDIQTLNQKELRLWRKSIGMVFQQFNLLQNKTVAENVGLALELYHFDNPFGVKEVLEFVGLSDKADAYPSQLSGGQQQRVGIARALVTRPSILLCDEPTSALDARMTDEIANLLRKAHEVLGLTIVIVSHELDFIRQLCDRVAVLEHGKLIDLLTVKKSDKLITQAKDYHQRVLEVLADE